MFSITFGSLATITSAAMGYVPLRWPNGLHLPGGKFVSMTNACLALLLATILLGLLTIIAAWWEKKQQPPGGPPPAGPPAAISGDQPRPLTKQKLWAWGAVPALFGAGAGQAIPSHAGGGWQFAAAFLCPLFAGVVAYLILERSRARRAEAMSIATLE